MPPNPLELKTEQTMDTTNTNDAKESTEATGGEKQISHVLLAPPKAPSERKITGLAHVEESTSRNDTNTFESEREEPNTNDKKNGVTDNHSSRSGEDSSEEFIDDNLNNLNDEQYHDLLGETREKREKRLAMNRASARERRRRKRAHTEDLEHRVIELSRQCVAQQKTNEGLQLYIAKLEADLAQANAALSVLAAKQAEVPALLNPRMPPPVPESPRLAPPHPQAGALAATIQEQERVRALLGVLQQQQQDAAAAAAVPPPPPPSASHLAPPTSRLMGAVAAAAGGNNLVAPPQDDLHRQASQLVGNRATVHDEMQRQANQLVAKKRSAHDALHLQLQQHAREQQMARDHQMARYQQKTDALQRQHDREQLVEQQVSKIAAQASALVPTNAQDEALQQYETNKMLAEKRAEYDSQRHQLAAQDDLQRQAVLNALAKQQHAQARPSLPPPARDERGLNGALSALVAPRGAPSLQRPPAHPSLDPTVAALLETATGPRPPGAPPASDPLASYLASLAPPSRGHPTRMTEFGAPAPNQLHESAAFLASVNAAAAAEQAPPPGKKHKSGRFY